MELEGIHVALSPELLNVIGSAKPGTRIYQADGDSSAFMLWWDTLAKHFPRGLVSPGGAAPYAGVSRAAIHKAMREGRLTVFAFHPFEERRGVFGSKLVRSNPFQYLPAIELKAWNLELSERIGRLVGSEGDTVKLRTALRRELEGEKPDWRASFLDEHPSGRVVKRTLKGRGKRQ